MVGTNIQPPSSNLNRSGESEELRKSAHSILTNRFIWIFAGTVHANNGDWEKVTTQAEDQILQLIHQRELEAKIEEAKHKYSNLILNDVDEFKWKEFAENRIAELRMEQRGQDNEG